MAKLNLGAVTAYADAVAAGYKGTREEFGRDQADFAANAAAVAANLEESKKVLADVNTAGEMQVKAVRDEGAAQVGNVGEAAEEKKQEIADLDAVQFTAQEKTDAEKAQARTNIGAAAQKEVDSLSSAIVNLGAVNSQPILLADNVRDGVHNGITFAWDGEICTVTGTGEGATAFNSIFASTTKLPENVVAGETYFLEIKSTDRNIGVRTYFYHPDGTAILKDWFASSYMEIPSDTVGLVVRLNVTSGKTVNGTIRCRLLSEASNKYLHEKMSEYILESTNNAVDVSDKIEAMLSEYGVCRLGAGTFFVTGVDMPDNTSLIGSGTATKIVLLAGITDGYAIKLGSKCIVDNLTVWGLNSVDLTLTGTVGKRHGILFKGNRDDANDDIPKLSTLSNLYIARFNGGGITCRNTGYAINASCRFVNCTVENCEVGINIDYWSEFHNFTNVYSCYNYYGCINNGGNNVFENCNFSRNTVGFMIDDSEGQSINNSHGSAIGCTFNHNDSNTGVGIKLIGVDFGFIFSGCQVFYSAVESDNSKGIVMSNCNFGSGTNITVNGGGLNLFEGCMFVSAPTINVTNNVSTKFINSFTLTGDMLSACDGIYLVDKATDSEYKVYVNNGELMMEETGE